jgi:hypothetical protein
MQMKLFGRENSKHGLEVLALEKDVNAWLERHPKIRLVDVKQSSNGGSWATTKLFISVWYEEDA